MLIERLEQGRGLPKNANHNRVRQVRDLLMHKLDASMQSGYRWLAACTGAVEAGRWGGERRRKRRLKLSAMIGECCQHLGEPNPLDARVKGWEMAGLHYGYGAIQTFRSETEASIGAAVMIGMIDSGHL